MAKSISIKEDGTSKTLSVDKLRTRLSGGGTCNWSPDSNIKLAPVIIRKNGTYKATDLGVYGISAVTVNTDATGPDCELNGAKAEGNIRTVNVAIAEGETARLFTTNRLKTNLSNGGTCEWVPDSSINLAVKRITANGTYRPKSKYYGYSQITVNVPHKSDGTDKYPYTPIDPYDGGSDAPAYIRVTTPPNNVNYFVGDTIDYTGIECTMYAADGSVFTDSDHPNGILVESELTFPVNEAPEISPDEDQDEEEED